jgi:methylmalonyl-CoA mutase N-terminal domain/subunit
MKVKMLKNQYGSDTDAQGAQKAPQTFEAGKSYDVCDKLAKTLVEVIGCAEYAKDEEPAPAGGPEGETPEQKKAREKAEKEAKAAQEKAAKAEKAAAEKAAKEAAKANKNAGSAPENKSAE